MSYKLSRKKKQHSLYLLIVVFIFFIAATTGCAKSKDKSTPPESLPEESMTDETDEKPEIGVDNPKAKFDAFNMPEESNKSMYKESVVKKQDIAKPQKFTIITGLTIFTNSCENIQTPEQAVLHFFNALGVYTDSVETGLKFLKEILSVNAFISEGKLNPKTAILLKRVVADPRIINSYIGGVKPDFELPLSNAITVSFFHEKNNQIGQNRWKIYVKSSGKTQHTAIVVEYVKDRWRIAEFNEVITKLSEDSH
ncbi:MAG: hypothetical protein K8S87_02060 [Planctomycetes bacterium]|nr:hypothetical protein [Planctomycetota bacterium]